MDFIPLPPLRLRREGFVSLLPPPQKKERKMPCAFRLDPKALEALKEMQKMTGHSQAVIVEHALFYLREALKKEKGRR
jgi:hypothetical protein